MISVFISLVKRLNTEIFHKIHSPPLADGLWPGHSDLHWVHICVSSEICGILPIRQFLSLQYLFLGFLDLTQV